jgi:uncharacterized membrane protein
MKELFLHLHFAKPLFLLLLLLLPVLWVRFRKRSFPVALWRSAIFLLLVLTLADPERVSQVTQRGERIFAFDLSRSIPQEMKRWMAESAKRDFAVTPSDRTFVFGGEAKEVTDWERWVRGEVSASPIKPDETSLENLIVSLSRLPAGPQTVFLFTDGWETQGSVERLLPSLALAGLRVFPVLPSNRPEAANVAVRKLLAPHQGASGEGINLKVVVENLNAEEVEGNLILRRNGEPFKNEVIKLKPGSRLFTYQATLPSSPMTSFQASFAPRRRESDPFPQDNQATAWVAVSSKEKVLLLNGRSGEGRTLEEILRRRGFEVTSSALNGSPPSPAGYGVVVFNNVEREKFSSAYLSAIERHVAAGNAFLMLGGEGSFAPGGYRQTPVETVLPVELKEPKREEKNRAVILVIDKSGSMREGSKLLYAKEAAKAVTKQLKENDLLGVLGFDIEPFVVVPLAPVGKTRGTLAEQIDRLKAQGKTYLYPALVEAKRQLERQSAGRKHVIILSDGETGGSGGDYIDLVTVMKKDLGVTVSAVAIGGEANIPLMKRIAQYGGGLFHHTFDPVTLPQIVVEQIQEKPDPGPLVEKDFTPVAVKGSELLSGLSERSFPLVKGYIETEIKAGAHLDLVIPREGKRSPLLASWSYGKGKAVAFTTDLHGRWSREWIAWAGLERFWGRVFEWLRPPKESLPPHEIRINPVGNRPVLELYLYGEADNGSFFRYSFTGKGAKGEGKLKRLAPGHYQAELPFSRPGDYRMELIEENHGKRRSYPPLGYSLPFDPRSELPQDHFNIPLLEQIARLTRGAINPGEENRPKTEETIRTSSPLRPHLILLVVVLFLSEIIFRRFYAPT